MGLPTEINALSLGATEGYKVANSLRFRLSNSAYLLRSFPTAGNRKTWTFSAWVKRGLLTSGFQSIFGTYTSGSDTTALGLHFHSDDCLRVTGWSTIFRVTTQVFRDPTAWYHIVWAFDSTQATASNRSRIYVNGVEITAYSTNNAFTQNTDYGVNQAGNHSLGVWFPPATTGYGYLDGYMAEVNFIDGQALTPSAFAQTDILTGAWNPKKYSGTYGTNGFYLPFNTSFTSSFAGTFNGSSQYLTTATNANLALGTSDFTIEYWVNFTAATNGGTVCCAGSGATSFDGLFGYVNSGQLQTYLTSTGGSWDVAAARAVISSITLGRWYHIAYTRSGSTFRVFVDGTQVDTFTSAASLYQSGNQFSLCRGQNTGLINGLLSNVRVIKGTALYTSNFTPSASPLTAVTNTQLLTLQNSTIIDNSPNALSITNTGSVAMSVNTPWATQTVGTDSSGNGNQWTSSGITISQGANTTTYLHDVYIDVPTNWNDSSTNRANYPTLNPLSNLNTTLNSGNLYQYYAGSWSSALATIGVTSGKWYMEAYQVAVVATSYTIIGVAYQPWTTSTHLGGSATSYGFQWGGATSYKYFNNNGGTAVSTPSGTLSVGGILQLAFDADTGNVWYGLNNTWAEGNPSAGTGASHTVSPTPATGVVWHMGIGQYGGNASAVNFGQRPFNYTPPTGFKALNSYNLPNPSLPLV